MGVPSVWLVDPIRRAAYQFGDCELRLADPNRLAVPGTPIVLDLAKVFAGLD